LIQGAAGLSPCRDFDTQCKRNDLFHTKYHGNWSAATADFVALSTSWNFNAAGYEFVPSPHLSHPYIPDLFITNASHIFAKAGQLSFPDVFSDAFYASTDQRVAAWCSQDQHVDLPRRPADVIGYYFEDQPLWHVSAARAGSAATTPTDWVAATRSLPAAAAGKGEYVTWLSSRYNGTPAGLERARPVYSIPASVRSWSALRSWNFSAVQPTSAAVLSEDSQFLGLVAERLFSVSAAAVRRHDPGALVFGQRFLSRDAPPAVLAAAGRHFDVVSVQPSAFSPESLAAVEHSAERLANISRLAAGRPVFVADQSTHFRETEGALQPTCKSKCVNETEAGALYGAFLAALRRRRRPNMVVGYAHCQFINRAVSIPVPAAGPAEAEARSAELRRHAAPGLGGRRHARKRKRKRKPTVTRCWATRSRLRVSRRATLRAGGRNQPKPTWYADWCTHPRDAHATRKSLTSHANANQTYERKPPRRLLAAAAKTQTHAQTTRRAAFSFDDCDDCDTSNNVPTCITRSEPNSSATGRPL
jgi:hypothetical protein